jgi:hypothetical protein
VAEDIMEEIRINEEGYDGWGEQGSVYYGYDAHGAIKEKPKGWQRYSDETIKEFKEGVRLCKLAYVYAQRIDWLVSCDDGEESFHERLKEELEEVANEIKQLDEKNWHIGEEKREE